MKFIKRLIVAALTFTASFLMINAVLAENTTATNEGSITITGTTSGKVYEVYKIFDLTYSGTKVAYTIDSDWANFFKEGGAGAEYITTTKTDGLNQITYTDEEGNKSTRYINITEDNVKEFAQKALAYVGANDLTADGSKEATGDTTTIDGLELGYYLVYPQGATDIKTDEGWASIASLTSTLPNAEVVVKATYPTIKKETTNGNTFDVGEYAQFKITGIVPDTTGYDTYDYIINDTWTQGLQLDTTKVEFTVTIGGKAVNITPVYNATNTGFTLTFDMTDYQTGEYKIGDEIVVTYKLLITENAIDSTTTQNSATLTYSSDPTDSTIKTTTPPQEVFVYSSKIVVTKVDGATCTTDEETGVETCTTTLAGATFVLKNSAGEYYKATYEGTNLISVTWVAKESDATHLTTGEDGVITFAGLKDGNYNLEETEAPEGYNRLTAPVSVTITGSETQEGQPIPVFSTSTIKNNTGIELPSTGGMGTTLFIVIGSLLTITSAILLITNKRMSKECE